MPQNRNLYLKIYISLFFIIMLVLGVSLFNKLVNYKKYEIAPYKIPVKKKLEEKKQRCDAHDLRAIWMSRFDYTRHLKTRDPEKIKKYISSTFKKMARANFNAVFFQVRGNADAYYQSKYEPWGELLTGELGRDPGWDPLQYAIDEAQKYGLDLHAWVNVFPAWRGSSKPQPTDPLHPFLHNPDWLVHDSSGQPMKLNSHYVSFSPGNPEVQAYLLQVLEDIVENYNVDGIHFDYIRYPEGGEYSKDPISLKRFKSEKGNPLKLSWNDWQREQVTAFVSKAYNLLTARDSGLIVSAAVIGSYKQRKWNGYKRVYQDAKRWLELEKIDMIIPMLYVGRKQNGSGFRAFASEWIGRREPNRKIIAGLGVFKISWQEVLREIDDYRNFGFDGCCFFSASSMSNRKFNSLKHSKFKNPAKPPCFSYKKVESPPKPHSLGFQQSGKEYILTWKVNGQNIKNLDKFVIYGCENLNINVNNPEHIVAILPSSARKYELLNHKNYKYFFITTLNSVGQESSVLPFPALEKG